MGIWKSRSPPRVGESEGEPPGPIMKKQTSDIRKLEAFMTPIRLITPKRCSCGALHLTIPNDARHLKDEHLGGWYWECACNSKLFHPLLSDASLPTQAFKMPASEMREPMTALGMLFWAAMLVMCFCFWDGFLTIFSALREAFF